jgi:hypothetical protein
MDATHQSPTAGAHTQLRPDQPPNGFHLELISRKDNTKQVPARYVRNRLD